MNNYDEFEDVPAYLMPVNPSGDEPEPEVDEVEDDLELEDDDELEAEAEEDDLEDEDDEEETDDEDVVSEDEPDSLGGL